MWFITYIVTQLEKASDWFYDAYLEVFGWIWPFDLLASPLYGLSWIFAYLASYFGSFNEWLVWVKDKIDTILSSTDIWSLFSDIIAKATNTWNWIVNAWENVTSIIDGWWSSWWLTIQTWINGLVDGWNVLLNDVKDIANNAQSSLNNFLTVTLPNLVGWGDLESVILSKLTEWFPFYNTLSALMGEIESFFTDPLQWLYDRLDDFFERFW